MADSDGAYMAVFGVIFKLFLGISARIDNSYI